MIATVHFCLGVVGVVIGALLTAFGTRNLHNIWHARRIRARWFLGAGLILIVVSGVALVASPMFQEVFF